MWTKLIDLSAVEMRRFRRRDYLAYSAWFSDAELNLHLGPIDEAWLTYVLADEGGSQFSFISEDELIGVAGLCHPGKRNEDYVLTDIAVRPNLRRQGIAAGLILKLLGEYPWTQSKCLSAYIAPDNAAALGLFRALGWVKMKEASTPQQMRHFTFNLDQT